MFDGILRVVLPRLPRSIIWTVAKRYVAGSTLDEALERIAALRGEGFVTILDVLGEAVTDLDESRAAAAEYTRALEALDGVDDQCTISVKPTHMGLNLDPDVCVELLEGLCRRAAEDGRRVRLEMEDHPTVGGTLDVFRRVRDRHENLGIVLQSRLFRTEDDTAALLDAYGAGLDVRLVKGIYLEPAAVAWTEAQDISDRYVERAEQLLAGGATLGLATHDDHVTKRCLELLAAAGRLGKPWDGEGRYEFQCLMGVRRPYAEGLRDDGHRVAIYVPYGTDWHAYSMRRLEHNPEIARHIMKAALGFEG